MAKVIYSVSMSLDGFIAGPDGDMSWLTPFMGENPVVDELMSSVTALLIGRTDDPLKGQEGEGEPFGGGWSGLQVVLTHTIPAEAPPDHVFVDDFARALAIAKDAAGDGAVGVLGASVARQCIEAGELDEVLVCIPPVMLGGGTRLFEYPGGRTVQLERISVSHTPTDVNIWYRIVR